MNRPAVRATVRYGLPDTERVRADLTAVGLLAADGTAEPGAEDVLANLARAGRPELAVQTLARLLAAAGTDESVRITEALRTEQGLRARIIAVLGGSTTLGEHLVTHPTVWPLLRREPLTVALVDPLDTRRTLAQAVGLAADADRCVGTDGARAAVTGPEAVTALRRAYRDRLMLIAAHDLAPGVDATLEVEPLPSVCRALSDLADATVQAALAVAAAALPPSATPCRLSVIAMGKTGARELNYLSDVDVIFVADHPTPGDADDRDASEAAMLSTATTLASTMMRICGQVAWEVDANLRPEGVAGALVRTPDSLRAYYTRWAQTWEFQALLKSRPAAGDPEVGRAFLEIIRPLVWAAAGRASFVEDVQAMRRRVEANIPRAHRERELKLGAGGLRDVEFAVQLLQLVHGRGDESLRVAGTLSAIRQLIRGGYVGRIDGAEMAAAYTFLRRAEHRLQLQRLRRTHLLPDDERDLEWLSRCDGYTASGSESAAEVFTGQRSRHAATVRRLHEKLFYRPLLNAVAAVGDDARLSVEAAAERFAALGFSPDSALRHLAALTTGVSRKAAIQRTLLPVLLDTFAECPDPDAGLLAYRQVSEALAETPWFLRLLRDEGTVAVRLAGLLGGSKLVADLLLRAPEVLRLLADDEALRTVDPDVVAGALLARSRRAGNAQDGADAARSARRHEMLRLACGDLLGLLDIHTVARGLTLVAEATVQAAFEAAWRQIETDRGTIKGRMSVIGMGRLGGAELGYGSDADVMYVAEPDPGADTDEVIGACVAVADLVGRMLGRPSPDPSLSLDANLRPEGRNGRLVRTLDSYRSYWQRFAAAWERQALLRARPIAGDLELAAEFVTAADPVRYPTGGLPAGDAVEIRRIKARVDAERMPKGADPTTHTKLGLGGLADIEWTVQLLQLQHGDQHPGLRVTGTLPAIAAAVDAGLIERADADRLRAGWTSATRARNAIMLVRGKPEDQLPRQGAALVAVAEALGYHRGGDPGEFVDDYRRTARRARRVVDRLFDGHGDGGPMG
jgi:glutamate-ammonia-ligase adenylyltransferase